MNQTTEIMTLAAVKDHKLARDMVNGSRPLTAQAATRVLEHLRRCPDKPGADVGRARTTDDVRAFQIPGRRPSFQDIPAGFYATPSATGSNDLDFWKVTVGKHDFRAVKRVIGGGTALTPQLLPVTREQQMTALKAILLRGIETSQNLYADNEHRCTDCGRQLTDQESRDARRGPVCRSK